MFELTALASMGAGALFGAVPLGWALIRERHRGSCLHARAARTTMQMDWLVQSLPIAMVVVDRRGRIESCSGGALATVGYQVSGVVGRTVHDPVYESESLVRLVRELAECDVADAEFQIEGRTLQALHISRTAPWEESVVRIAIDVTDCAESEDRARRLGQIVNSLVESVPHAIAMLEVQPDGEYVFTFANHAFAAYANRTVDEVIGCTPAQVLGQRQLDAHEAQLARAIRIGRPVQFDSDDESWPRAGGIVSTTLVPLFSDSGTCSSVIHVARDVTEERNRRAQARTYESATLGQTA